MGSALEDRRPHADDSRADADLWQSAASRPGESQAWHHQRPHPVARPRRVEGPRPSWYRPRLGRSRERRVNPERQALRPGGARVACSGDEPRRDGQGQSSEHPGVCHPPRHSRAGCRRKGIDRQPRQQHPLERHDRRRRRRDRSGDPVSRTPLHRRRGATPSGRSPTSSSWPRKMATSPTSAATGTKGSSRGTSV